jgi:hypothetical protein
MDDRDAITFPTQIAKAVARCQSGRKWENFEGRGGLRVPRLALGGNA